MHKLPATSEPSSKTAPESKADRVTCPECRHEFAPDGNSRPKTGHSAQDKPESFAVGHDSPSLSQKAQRPHGSPLATMVRWLLLAAVLVGAMTGLVFLVVSSGNEAADDHSGRRSSSRAHSGSPLKGRDIQASSPSAKDPVVQAIERSVVRIETAGPAGTVSLGSGFVVDAKGLVATNYHVVSEATQGKVRFKNGTAYDIAGYVALNPDNDLAIVELRDAPENLQPLQLRSQGDPARRSDVIAVGHPDGVGFSLFNGNVSQVLLTSQLSDRSQRFLEQHLNRNRPLRWIQHTAVLTEGNSGGPLLDRQGRVVGINTWVDKETEYGYALHARYLTELLKSRLPSVAPLETYSTQEARFAAAIQRLQVERVNRLFREAKKMHWAPRSRLDYQTLQQLALAITQTRLRATGGGSKSIPDEQLESLIQAIDAIEADIEKQSLEIIEQLTLLNEFAAKELFDESEGLIFVATVDQAFEGPSGDRGMLVLLAGYDQKIFVPLNDIFLSPQPGAHYLIIGLTNGQVVRFGMNPLDLEVAPIVLSRTIVPLQK